MNKRRLMQLLHDRAEHLDAATAALQSGDQDLYNTEFAAATAMNAEIEQLRSLIDEDGRYADAVPSADPMTDIEIENMADILRNGGRITLNNDDVSAALRETVNSVLIGTDTLVKPTGIGTTIRDTASGLSGIINAVSVMDLHGCSGWDEPYVKELSTAAVGTDGTAPAVSEPVFRVAGVRPVLVNTLAYVSRHINNLTPVAYLEKVKALALNALKVKVASLITNGDGSTFYGFVNASNTKGEAIGKTMMVNEAAIGPGFLRKLVLGSGSSTTTGYGVLQLTREDLMAFGDVRGANEKKPVYDIEPDASTSGNTGYIKDGGLSVPYIINPNLKSLSTATAGAAAISTMVFGDPGLYLLGLFGDYTVEVSKDYKFAEGLLTVLGEVMAGGNLIAHEAATVVTLAAKA